MMDEKKRSHVIVRTSIIGIFANVLLVIFKGIVGILANSVSIIMDALNNLTDALSSVITIIGTKLSLKRPDKNHPYGYGRIEYITSTLIAALILFAGGMALYESINSIIDYYKNGTMPDYQIYSIIIISMAIVVKILLGLYFRYQAKKVNSENLNSSGLDALFDSLLSIGTLISLIFAMTLHFYIEGYVGILIGLFIIKSGIELIKESLSSMIGNRFDKDLIKEIKQDIVRIPNVLGAYDLILNSYGHNKNIGSIHIAVSDTLEALEIQKIEREIASLMQEKYNTILTTGIYVLNSKDEDVKEMNKSLNDIIKKHKNVLQYHGFYYEKNKDIMSFDLVISFDEENVDDLILSIKEDMQKLYPNTTILINFDQDFSLSE